MRVFIAFELSIPTVESLVLLQEDLSEPFEALGLRVRWTDATNIHMTIKFLGDIEDTLAFRIRGLLRDFAAKRQPFEFDTTGTGAFPTARRPRILWAGCGEGRGAVLRLQRDLETMLWDIGVDKDSRDFHPHSTVGRVRTRDKAADLSELLAPYRHTAYGPTQVRDIALFQSILTPRGPIYRPIERFPLSAK